jgi:PAS domain S-box-containing protein
MRLFGLKYTIKFFNWIISSGYRIIASAFILSIFFVLLAVFYHPLVLGIASILLFCFAGFIVHSIRLSAVALDYPGIDRFFQQVPCYCTIQNRDMKIIRTNKLFRQDFGSKMGELCYEAYKGSDKICDDCPVIKTFADGKSHSTEENVRTRDGNEAHMLVNTTPVIDENGLVVGVMEMSTNITEIKQLQKQIEKRQKEYIDLFERVPCYISILDKEFRITRVNQLFQQEFGDRSGELCYKVYHDRDTICEGCLVGQTFKDGEIHSTEKTVFKTDGTEARLIVYSSPIYNGNGELTAVMEMATDITEVKRLQHKLTYMGRTIALMAHRIKNILMGLEGGIFVVESGMEDGNDELLKKGWGMIQRNVIKVSSIVKDLLYCSKERPMDFQIIDPIPIIQNVFELFEGKAKKENIDFKIDIPETLPQGKFDPDALHCLISNMVSNAFDACINDASEGKLDHQIIINARYNDTGKYIFQIEDDGSGIPGAVGDQVFEDFFSTKGREGTGLGLMVAQQIIEEHRGNIIFNSTEGKGTTFRAIFPHDK